MDREEPCAIEWAIEYWRGGTESELVHCRHTKWRDAPNEGVLFVYVVGPKPDIDALGKHPHPTKRGTMVLCGKDNYYLTRGYGQTVFGGWTDPDQPWARADNVGNRFTWWDHGELVGERLDHVPWTSDLMLKKGVMLPDEAAIEFGLLGNKVSVSRGKILLKRHEQRILC